MTQPKQRRTLPPVGSVWGDLNDPIRWWIVYEHDKRSAVMARWGDHNTERISGQQFWLMVKHYGYQCIHLGGPR